MNPCSNIVGWLCYWPWAYMVSVMSWSYSPDFIMVLIFHISILTSWCQWTHPNWWAECKASFTDLCMLWNWDQIIELDVWAFIWDSKLVHGCQTQRYWNTSLMSGVEGEASLTDLCMLWNLDWIIKPDVQAFIQDFKACTWLLDPEQLKWYMGEQKYMDGPIFTVMWWNLDLIIIPNGWPSIWDFKACTWLPDPEELK